MTRGNVADSGCRGYVIVIVERGKLTGFSNSLKSRKMYYRVDMIFRENPFYVFTNCNVKLVKDGSLARYFFYFVKNGDI